MADEIPNNRLPAADRYLRDVHFRGLVDCLFGFLHGAEFTPTELREALTLASVKFESLRPVQILTSTPLAGVRFCERR